MHCPRTARSILSLLSPYLLLALSVALFFWPVWLRGYTFPQGGGDLWGQLYPVWSFISEHLRRGTFPLWDHRMMGGDPIIAEPQYGLLNPVNWPLFLLNPIPHWAVLLRGMFPLFVGGVGMYIYLRRSPVWGVGRIAALTGAVAYMLSDPYITHLGHPQINDVISWLPWGFWAVDVAIRWPRYLAPASLPLALMGAAGHIQTALYGAVALTLYGLWRGAEGHRSGLPRRAGTLLLLGLVALGLVAPTLLPAIERYPFTERAALEIKPYRGYQWVPSMWLDLLSPWFHGRGTRWFWGTWGRIESGYVGAVALYLAAVGLLGEWRYRRARFLLGLGLLAWLFALGYNGPLSLLMARVDLIARMGKTGRTAFLLCFVLSVGAALGIERLSTDRRRFSFTAGSLLMVGVVLWFMAPLWASRAPAGEPYRHALVGLRAAAGLAVALVTLWLLSTRSRLWIAAVPLLLVAELVTSGALVEVEPPAGRVNPHTAALDFLRADPGWFRVDVDARAQGLWSSAALQIAGFEVPQGTGNPMELRPFNIFFWSIPYRNSPAYCLLGVKYIIVPKGSPPGGEGIWPVFDGDTRIDIHLNTLALPRVWLVYRTEEAADYGDAFHRVQDPNFQPDRVAVVENGPRLEREGSGRIEVRWYSPNKVAFNVYADVPALLVLSDTHYPGWEGYVDGLPTPIYRTDAVFRGIEVPPGAHLVEMRFRPESFRIGLGLAVMAGIAALAAVWIGRKAELRHGDTAVSPFR